MKIRMKNKPNKNDLQLSIIKNRWIFFKLVEWVEGLILKHVLFIWSYLI